MRDPFQHTVTCSVCGYARGIRGVYLACCCRGWVAFWRAFLAGATKPRIASQVWRT